MQVTLDNGKILEIEKLKLGKYADLLKAFEELPKHFNELKEFKTFTTERFIEIVPNLLGSCLPDFIRVVKIATTLTEEEIDNLGLHELIEILGTIYTVNNYSAVFEKLKKAVPNQNQKPKAEITNLAPID